MKARMTDRVRLPDGEVATLNALLAAGRLTFSTQQRFPSDVDKPPRTHYFAGVGDYVVEVSAADYKAHAATAAGRADAGKHSCTAHAGYNLANEHVCLRCGKPIGVYGDWCRDPQACADKGYCPKEPTCAD